MLRLAAPGWRLPAAVMSDLSLVRYLGYADLPQAQGLRERLSREQPEHLAHGVHLIVVQGADGSLVVGDSHHYDPTPDPFAREEVDRLILEEFAAVFGEPPPDVIERWTGTYASAGRHSLVECPMSGVRMVVVHQADPKLLHRFWPRRKGRRRAFWHCDGRSGMSPTIKAVVFDWAGTMIDHGCRAPVVALQRAFAEAGVEITEAEARADMGMAKRDHIRALLAADRVSASWRERRGRGADDADVSALFESVEPMMRVSAAECAQLIPGAAAQAAALREQGIRIGSGTGYSRSMMTDILPRAAAQGYSPDVVVCAGETAEGRPSPLMMWKALAERQAPRPALRACVKVDDAPGGDRRGPRRRRLDGGRSGIRQRRRTEPPRTRGSGTGRARGASRRGGERAAGRRGRLRDLQCRRSGARP